MNLKSIMLSERSQMQKATYLMISFIQHSGKGSRDTNEISNCQELVVREMD